MTDQYAVVGNPIAHSKSPLIHRLFAEQTGEELVYEAILIDVDEKPFAVAVKELMALGYKGLNVTVPYKLDAFTFADTRTDRARVAEAVNTLTFTPEGVVGDNTDGIGLVEDIEQLAGVPLKGKRILVLGAGGAVQGVLKPLLDAAPAHLFIANRTAERARQLAQRFKDQRVEGGAFATVPEQPFDVIINGTAASLSGEVPPIPEAAISADSLVYDMMYGAEPTVFLHWARETQPACTLRDGLGMLVCQAAEAFALWRGIRPQTAPVLDAVRRIITQGA